MMKIQRNMRAVMLAVLLGTIACATISGGSSQDATVSTEKPAEKPTVTPTPEPEPETSADFATFENEVFSIKYPADWYYEGMAGLGFFASDESLQETWFNEAGGSPDVEHGAMLVVLAGTGTDVGISEGVSLLEAFNATIGLEAGDCEVREDAEETTINDQSAVIAVWACTNPVGISTIIIGAMIADEDDAAGLTGITAVDSEDEYLPILRAMIESFRFV